MIRAPAALSRAWLLFAVLPLMACPHSPDRPAPGGDTGEGQPLSIPHERYTLENGLTVILHRDVRLPLVAVSVWYDVGALHERAGRSGFAHLFEHMMFQGSPHVGEDMHFKILESIGVSDANGTTSFDRTNYFETVPSNELETVLWLESDRMGFLLTSLTEKSLKNQIDVVQNERRQSVENRPYGLMSEKIMQTLYPKSHPYHGNVIGSMADIQAATLDDVQGFFNTYYTPANATIALAGNFEIEPTKALIKKYFASLSGSPKPQSEIPKAPTIDKETVINWNEPVAKLPKLSVVWMGPSAFGPDNAALDLLAHVISGTRSARLDKRVAFDDLIAQSVTAYFQEHKSGGQFQIDLVVRPGRSLDEAQAAIDEVLAGLKTNPPTEAELRRAWNAQESRMIRGLQKLGGFGGRAEKLQLYNNHFQDPGRLAWDIDRYRKVTTEDLLRVYQTYLNDKRLIVRASPKGAAPKKDRP